MLRRLPAIAWIGIAVAVALAVAFRSPQTARAAAPRLVIAVIGDYGDCAYSCTHEQAVANLVHSWRPDAIMTVGDNSYESGTASEVPRDQAPYAADVQAGRFYAIAGNHDWGNTCNPQAILPSTNYFGRAPHYTAHLGNGLIDLFATDMNCGDPGGDSATSQQAAWYRAQVAASTAIWKVTADHQAFYSSGEHGTQNYTHWAILPAVDLFLSGHDHDFEHLVEEGKNFVVDGAGGRNLTPVGSPIAGSVWRDSVHFGAVRLTVTPETLRVEFVDVSGTVEHAFPLFKTAEPPPAGAGPSTSSVTGGTRAQTTHPATSTIAGITPMTAPLPETPAQANGAGIPRVVRGASHPVLDVVALAIALSILIGASVLLYRRLGNLQEK